MEIGFIGLGKMGFHLARRLVKAGHALVVTDVRDDAVRRLTALGASPARTPREVADRAETVMTSLPSLDAVREVAIGGDGVIVGRTVRRFVDLSTTGARLAIRVAEALAGRNIAHIDSPVSGGPAGAEKGTLAVMVSGPRAEIEFLHPVLSVFGKVFVIGERPGMGQTMKLANNLLSASAMVATSEAMVMGVKAGLDPAVMLEVINAGSGRNSATQDKFPRAILPGSFDFGFTNGHMDKDLQLCMEETAALGLSMPLGRLVQQKYREATEQMGADADFTTIVKCVEGEAGVEVRARSAKA